MHSSLVLYEKGTKYLNRDLGPGPGGSGRVILVRNRHDRPWLGEVPLSENVLFDKVWHRDFGLVREELGGRDGKDLWHVSDARHEAVQSDLWDLRQT